MRYRKFAALFRGKPVTVISVVFPVFNNLETVKVTLAAILEQDLPSTLTHKVIVVDDGSAQAMKSWLANLSDPRCKVISFTRNCGRSAARNAGVRAGSGEVVVFLDSDVIVGRRFLAEHAATLGYGTENGHVPACAISLGRLIDTDTLTSAVDRPTPMTLPGPGHFTTANVAVLRSLLNRVQETPEGPFDAATFTRYGWEDLELELRLNKLSPKRARTNAALGFHVCPVFTPDGLPAMIRKEVDRAAMAKAFYAKHPQFSVRMVTQLSPLHRALWEILSLGGLLNERSLRPLLAWLAARGHGRLAEVIARHTILNPTYVRNL